MAGAAAAAMSAISAAAPTAAAVLGSAAAIKSLTTDAPSGGGGGYGSPSPGIYTGDKITLEGRPDFSKLAETSSAVPNNMWDLPDTLAADLQKAKEGGSIVQHYAKGEEVDLSPYLLSGDKSYTNPFAAKIRRSRVGPFGPMSFPVYSEGGEVEEHTPQFFSEGGLGAIDNRYVKGDGDGTSDSVPAMLANGEFVIPADVVSSLGNGSNDSGAEVLDKFLETVRHHKKQHDADELPPDSKGILSYLSEAHKKA